MHNIDFIYFLFYYLHVSSSLTIHNSGDNVMAKIFTGKMLRKQEAEEEKRFKRTYLPAAQLLIKFARKVMAEHGGLEESIELRRISHGIRRNWLNGGDSIEDYSQLEIATFNEMPHCYLELEREKRDFDHTQTEFNKFKSEVEQIRTRLGQHERELAQMQAELEKFLKKK